MAYTLTYNRHTMKCILVTPRAQSWIGNGRSARILHLFEKVINLVDEDGDVLSLSPIDLGPGPFTMIMDQDFPHVIPHIGLHDVVNLNPTNHSIIIGALHIETGPAPVWEPRPQWTLLRRSIIDSDIMAGSLPPALEAYLQNLLTAVRSDDWAAGRMAATALAGLGKGLTPAGDDVLMGVLFALWVWAPRSVWIDLIVDWAAPLTTTLSAAYLHAAAAGEATIHWHNLVAGKADAVDEILSIGHSSGNDAWAGFAAAFNSLGRKFS